MSAQAVSGTEAIDITPGPRLLRRSAAGWQRWAVVSLATALEVAVLLPFAFVSPASVLGLPAAFAIAVAASAAVVARPWQGAAVALAGAVFFTVVVTDFHPGAFAALGLWPALTLAVGVGAERSFRHRLRLEGELRHANVKLRALLDAGIALNAELALGNVLQQLVEAGRVLTGARFAALGLLDERRTGLASFFTAGIDDETKAAIGDPPRGHGILGLLIRDPRPLRLDDLTEHPAAAGFPPGHPPMRSFLGVPILVRGVAYGNLYLTEKEHGAAFTAADEELVQLLASQAAVAIENARLHEASGRWLRQLESLHEASTAPLCELDLQRLLGLVAGRLRELLQARTVEVSLPTADGRLRIEAADGEGASELVGLNLDRHSSKCGLVLERARPERVDSLIDDPEADQQTIRRMGIHSALFVPLVVRGRAIGVILAGDKAGADPRFTDDDLRLAQAFAERAAVAVELGQRVARERVRTILDAEEQERRRIAREIHDETGQALTSILLGLKGVERAASFEQARAACTTVRELAVSTLRDVRRLAVDLRPPVLDDFGVAAALERLAASLREQTGLAVDLDLHLPDGRLPGHVETAVYRVVQEALTNVVKHAQATQVRISLEHANGSLVLAVRDDGRGFAPAEVSGDHVGLIGMRERASLLDGRLEVISAAGQGTAVVLELPRA